jgi:hypothetical protein
MTAERVAEGMHCSLITRLPLFLAHIAMAVAGAFVSGLVFSWVAA